MKRFWDKVDKSGDCWLWTAGINDKGYGRFRYLGQACLAHRVVYHLTHGELPDRLRHTCDNPQCVNPAHLKPGTQADNLNDMAERGRGRRTHLHKTIVEQAKIMQGTQREVADILGIAQSTVGRIRRGEIT